MFLPDWYLPALYSLISKFISIYAIYLFYGNKEFNFATPFYYY